MYSTNFAYLLVAYFPYPSTLKMETVRSSETSVNFYQTTYYKIPENGTLYIHHHEGF
jgi:hypothetical protein